MNERGGTNWLFILGIGMIIAAAAIYGLLMLLGVSFAVGQASAEGGAPVLLILALPALALIGILLLLVKVIADRLGSAEDNHYSKAVDK